MDKDINSQISDARELFDQALSMKEIPKRNKLITRGMEKFEVIEKLNLTDIQKQKISNIRTTYSKEFLILLKPYTIDDDINTFLNLVNLNKNYKEHFVGNPQLKKIFDNFRDSLNRSPEFRLLISQIKTDQ